MEATRHSECCSGLNWEKMVFSGHLGHKPVTFFLRPGIEETLNPVLRGYVVRKRMTTPTP